MRGIKEGNPLTGIVMFFYDAGVLDRERPSGKIHHFSTQLKMLRVQRCLQQFHGSLLFFSYLNLILGGVDTQGKGVFIKFMQLWGIDSCPGGWAGVVWNGEQYAFQLLSDIDQIPRLGEDLRILIDIPIGLSEPGYPRRIEQKLRKAVAPRHSTVFNVPCRKAVYAQSKEEARQINIQEEGKSLSEQSLNICPKIREIDQFILAYSPWIYECHPELSFKGLNNGTVLLSKKTTPLGQKQRLEILKKIDPQLGDLYKEVRQQYPVKLVKTDDLLDAMALCVTNHWGENKGFRYLEDEDHQQDGQGIPLRIAFINPASEGYPSQPGS